MPLKHSKIIKMPDLVKSLDGHDLGHLLIIAELWGVDFDAQNTRQGVELLTHQIMDAELVDEIVEALPNKAKTALGELMRSNARLPWSLFVRRYGQVREMGPGRRDREKPYLNENASPSESLWYRGLVGRSFFDTPDGPIEFAYIPEDLLIVLPLPEEEPPTPIGRPASAAEKKHIILSSDNILDDACTLLAALRKNMELDEVSDVLLSSRHSPHPIDVEALKLLLVEAGLLDPDGAPIPDATQRFLEVPRAHALLFLVNAWRSSENFDELRLLPGVHSEGEWENEPLRTREMILNFINSQNFPVSQVQEQGETSESHNIQSVFWSMEAFVTDIHARYPDFQRPMGNYDSWYLRDEVSGEYLRGFDAWDDVDGKLLRYFVSGILFWLGIVDLALPEKPVEHDAVEQKEADTVLPVTGFRLSKFGTDLLSGIAPDLASTESEAIVVNSDGRISTPINSPRSVRYQIARICEWEGYKSENYRFRLTPESLQNANSMGIRVSHLITLFHKYAEVVPPNLIKALKRWEAKGVEARFERVTVLRVRDPSVMKVLRESRYSRFLGDPLGPTTVIVQPGRVQNVLAGLANLGFLGEVLIKQNN
jgi:hypothetical protein